MLSPITPVRLAKWYSFDRIVAAGLKTSLSEGRTFVTGVLLDVGCGSKPYAPLFRDRVLWHWGVDLPNKLSANQNPKNVDIYADLRNPLPFCDLSMDTVLCTEVIEHHSEPSFLFSEMCRVLNHGGHLILTAPQVWGLHEEPYDYYRFTKYGLQHLAEKAGFEVIQIRPRGGLWAMVTQRISSFLHFRFAKGRGSCWKLIIGSLCLLVQILGIVMDALFQHQGDTLGNTIIARKR